MENDIGALSNPIDASDVKKLVFSAFFNFFTIHLGLNKPIV